MDKKTYNEQGELLKEIKKLEYQGYILAMRLLQSNLVLDDVEAAARDIFILKTLSREHT